MTNKSMTEKDEALGVEEKLEYFKEIKERMQDDLREINSDYINKRINKKEYRRFLNQKIEGRTREEWVKYCNEVIGKGSLRQGGKRERLIKLHSGLKDAKRIKRRLDNEFKELHNELKKGLISKEEYDYCLNQKVKGKTKEEWINYCNQFINKSSIALKGKRLQLIDYRPVMAFLFVIMIIGISFIANIYTGYVAITKEFNYTDKVSLTVKSSYSYTWAASNYGKLKSIRLDGNISKDSSAKVYVEYANKSYLIFDSSKLNREGIGRVTGLITGNETIEDRQISNNPIINNSPNNKSIITDIHGGGRREIGDIFKFNIASEFNWDVDYSKLCAKWDVNNIRLCYGSENCCALIGLESPGEWNSTLYLSYGRYGSSLKNTVKAQVIYANYSLDIENPYSEVIHSDIKEMEAEFYEAGIVFTDICIETCLLPGFNESSYNLRFVIENGSLQISNIRYSIEKTVNISRNAPYLVKDIGNITVYRNEELSINLSDYFADEDNDRLSYSAYETDNMSIVIKDSIARIVPASNFTGTRYMYLTAYDGYYRVDSNMIKAEIIERPLKAWEVNISEELVKPKIIINKPVRWVKMVNVSDSVVNLSVNISSDALNVSVRDIKEDRIISEDKIKVNDNGIIKDSSAYKAERRIEQIEKTEDKLHDKKIEIIAKDPTAKQEISNINKELLELQNEKNKLTGYIVAVKGKGIVTKFLEWLFNVDIAGYAVAEIAKNKTNTTAVIIEDIVENVEIDYYTEGPFAEEENISNGKRITVSSDVHYEDILAYTYLDDVSRNKIRLYHVVNGSRELVSDVSYYDENGNNLVDMIEWIVPWLSNQTYEVIIEITKAEHLDENRTFVSDIYRHVKDLDGNWSEQIPDGHYVRATFRVPLDNTRDITVYARKSNSSNNSASIGVFIENENNTIAKFENINEENWYKVYLSDLEGSYDVFDLRSVGAVEYDYIVDPLIGVAGNISFVNPTPSDGYSQTKTYVEINVSIKANLSEVKFNWNGTNYTVYNDSLVLFMNFDNISALGEAGSKVVDISRLQKNNGTLYNAKWNASGGKYGGAFEFDGNGDYIEIGDLPSVNLSEAITVAFWVKPIGNTADYQTYVTKGYSSAWSIGRFTTATLSFRWYIDTTGSAAQIVTEGSFANGYWNHLAMTYDSATGQWVRYINGTVSGSTALSGNLSQSTKPLRIGQVAQWNSQYWANASIDELMIFNRSLSAAEIQQLYFTNLYKYDTDKWALYVNQSKNSTNGLSEGVYTYSASAKDTSGNENTTETRTISIGGDLIPPGINFTSPTPPNGTSQTQTYVPINVSITESSLSEVKFNWNGTNYTIFDDSLVMMFNFDNRSSLGEQTSGSGNKTVDITGHGNNGTIYGVKWNSSGKYGGGFDFGSNGEYINITQSGINGTQGTIVLWYKPDHEYDDGNDHSLVSRDTWTIADNDFWFEKYATDNFDFEIVWNDSDGGQGDKYTNRIHKDDLANYWTPNKWMHIAGTWDSSASASMNIYINGVRPPQYSPGAWTHVWVPPQHIFVGNDIVTNYPADGIIDELMIFNRALSLDEIRQLYFIGLTKFNQSQWYLYVNQSKDATNGLEDGTYTYSASAKDTAGNENTTETRTITVYSASPPTVTLNSPINNISSSNTTQSFNCSAVDTNINTTLANITFYWNYTGSFIANGSVNIGGESNSTNFTRAGLNDKLILWNCYACDNNSNCAFAAANYTITIDTITPNIDFMPPTRANGAAQTESYIFVNASANDSNYISTFIDFDDSLVSWWRFDDTNGSGDPSDYIGRNNGSKQGNAIQTEGGRLGKGFSFDGNMDYISLPISQSLNLTSQTRALWIKSTSNWGTQVFFSNEDGSYSSGKSLTVQWKNSTGGTKQLYLYYGITYMTKWTHIAIVYKVNGNTVNVSWYQNGIYRSYSNNTEGFSPSPLRAIGAEYDGDNGFNGTIDDVMVFNRTLSAGEISALYSNQSSRYLSGNFTDLKNGTHTFRAYTQDSAGNVNYTEERAVTIKEDATFPGINFTSPTPANGTTQSAKNVEMNASISNADDLSEVKFNWNGTNYTILDDTVEVMYNFNNISVLGENSTYVVDLSGRGLNGTIVGATINQTDGKYGSGIQIDANGEYVNITQNNLHGDHGTIMFWYKPSYAYDDNAGHFLFARYSGGNSNDFWIDKWSTNQFNFEIVRNGGGGTYTDRITAGNLSGYWTQNQWMHIVCMWNKSLATDTMGIYINGKKPIQTSPDAWAVDWVPPTNIYVGNDGSHNNDNPANGVFDDFIIFNRTFTADEIKEFYFTNLQKYNQTQWYLYVNQSKNSTTGLSYGTYTYSASAKDTSGNENTTETRTIKIMTSPSANKFAITDNSGNNVASIDNEGGMYLKKTAYQSQSSLSPPPNSFLIQNSTMDTIAYINSTGYLYLRGAVTENSDMSGMTATNLEFRNASGNIIAFFDNKGSLKLKGGLGENYENP